MTSLEDELRDLVVLVDHEAVDMAEVMAVRGEDRARPTDLELAFWHSVEQQASRACEVTASRNLSDTCPSTTGDGTGFSNWKRMNIDSPGPVASLPM